MIRKRARWLRKQRPRIAVTVPARLAIWSVSVFGIWQGSWILLSGPERWSGPSYAVLRALPFSPYIWGWWALISGILVAFGTALVTWRRHWEVRAVGLLGLSVWTAAFSVGTLAAAVTLPTAGTTAVPTYAWGSFVIAVLIAYDDAGSKRNVQGTEPRGDLP